MRLQFFDHAPERRWRHLDTMQYETELRARALTFQCEHCGVRTMKVPWAGKHSPSTWMFEAVGVAVPQSAASICEACELLRIVSRCRGGAARAGPALPRGLPPLLEPPVCRSGRAVMSSRLETVKKGAQPIDAHWQDILKYIKHRITNAVREGLNSRIQAIKARQEASAHSPTIACASSSIAADSISSQHLPAESRE